MRKIISFLLIGLLFGQSFFVYTLIKPFGVDRAAITAASATLSNPRRSFVASVNGAHTAGTTYIAMKTSGGLGAETSVAALFPGDSVMVGPNGSETVSSIPSASGANFVITDGLNVGASDNANIYATQSGTLTVAFTIGTAIPANGYAKVTIADPAANGNDGAPDYNADVSLNGFDTNTMTIANMATTGGTGCTWGGTETFTAGSGAGHTYQQVTTTQCTGGTITMTIGDGTKGLVNPARVASLGTADIYTITVSTHDSTNNQLETKDISVAVVEGVLVSASVDETLSFVVAGLTADTGTYCGITRTANSPDTTATTVPWGTLSAAYTAATHNTQQTLTVSTNADGGYKVYAQESDQMGLNGNTCTGTAPSAGDYTFGAGTCIRDTVCGSTPCTHTTAQDWGADPSSYPGFGYSLDDQSGTDAKFEYNDTGTFYSKQFADKQGSESELDADAELMTNSNPVDASQAAVCFRIDIPGTQPAGYYYNVLRYTAVPTF